MTALARHLRQLIALDGPIPLSRFMAEAVGHPEHGYYAGLRPIGAAGDFITAPEISQMFGELVGLWAADTWQHFGPADPILLVEMGPGRGTLMADMLRAAQVMPAFHNAIHVHLVETSPTLRTEQRQTLQGIDANWHDSLATLPAGPMLLIANEFFDALPVRQFERRARGWHERLVASNEERFHLVLSPDPVPAALVPATAAEAECGGVVEIAPAREAVVQAIAERIAAQGGAALIIDYGHNSPGWGDTLQAVKAHAFHDFLQHPGSADLTAHVDFRALGIAARTAGANIHGLVRQGDFLASLGIDQRAAALAAAAPARRHDIDAERERLVDPDQMGDLFKVLAITERRLTELAGFEAAP